MKDYSYYPINFINQPYWPIVTKIEYVQRRVIVSCIAYYELNESFLSDVLFDDLSKELLWYQEEYPDDAKKSRYFYVFKDYRGDTGYHIYESLDKYDKPYLKHLAKLAIKQFNKGR